MEEMQGVSVTSNENLLANLVQTWKLSRQHCQTCSGYHVGFAAQRLSKQLVSGRSSRSRFERILLDFLIPCRSSAEPIDVLIAGAADTGLVATCIKAASGVGLKADMRLHVIDRCRTPLELIKAYADEVGLEVNICQGDLFEAQLPDKTDIVVVHSLLRHVEPAYHQRLLSRLSTSLKPNGVMVFSSPISIGETVRRDVDAETQALEHTLCFHGLDPEEINGILACHRRALVGQSYVGEFSRLAQIQSLVAGAGLYVASEDIERKAEGGRKRSRVTLILQPLRR
jgi:SAM-dependent methyltransferase